MHINPTASRLAAASAFALCAVAPANGQETAPPAVPVVIHACYVPLTGTVYRIKAPGVRDACSSTAHLEFQWTDGDGALRLSDAAGGDLSGTFGAALVVGLQGHAVSNTAPTAGQVLTFDGTKWGPAAASGGVGADGSFLATGVPGVGAIPATGPGVRMMWYPAKAAFRAGATGAGYWDDSNVGNYSIALGLNVMASGTRSIAIGNQNVASGDASVALGGGSTASGASSTAIGPSTRATGLESIAIGSNVEASGFASTALGMFASTNGMTGSFVYGDASGGCCSSISNTAPNQFVVRSQQIWFGTNNTVNPPANAYIGTSTGAYLSTGGVWTNVSDVNRKHLFTEISSDEVLDRLAAMPVREWSYKAEADSIRHIGPTAHDFYAAFHLGSSDMSIPTIDADGVSLAAIKALAKRTRELQAENADLKSRLATLESEMRDLQRRSAERP